MQKEMTNKIEELIKDFEEAVTKEITLETTDYSKDKVFNSLYDVSIHIWRKPGMGNSVQIMTGNKLSVMTAIASMLEQAIAQNIMDERELLNVVKMVLNKEYMNYEENEEN